MRAFVNSSMRFELKNEAGKLYENNISNEERIYIEKGSPLKKDEFPLKFIYFHYGKETSETLEMFSLNFLGSTPVIEVKKLVLEHLNLLKNENPESHYKTIDLGDNYESIRFRFLLSKYPSTVIPNDSLIKDVTKTTMYVQEIAVQKLPEGQVETKKGNSTIISFFQRFYPSTYELGDKFELDIDQDEELDNLRNRLTELTGCQNVCLLEAERIENISLLKLKGATWYRPRENTNEEVKFKYKVRSIHARDGLIIIFRDNTEPFKDLTDEERKAIVVKESSGKSSIIHRERSLHIKNQDLDIDDETPLTQTTLTIDDGTAVISNIGPQLPGQ